MTTESRSPGPGDHVSGQEDMEQRYSAESRFHARAVGGQVKALERGRDRLVVTGLLIVLAFGAVSLRLVGATCFAGHEEARIDHGPEAEVQLSRADILDRNGQQLATSLATASLYADPKLVLDAHEAAAKLAEALPGLDETETYAKLASNKRFVWLKRNLTPRQHQAVHVLGLPGILFEREERRFYPPASLTAHVVGYTGVDNVGLAGLERSFDKPLKATVASDGLFVQCFFSGISTQDLDPHQLKKVVGHLSAHAVLILKRDNEIHICIVETLEQIDASAKRPLCVIICDLSQRVFSKRPIASKAG